MTKQEKIVVSAYTGVLMCDIEDYQKYVESLLKRPVFTHELADANVQNMIKNYSKQDFLRICESQVIIPSYGQRVINALRCTGFSKECDRCEYGYRGYDDSECNDACDYERYEEEGADLLERLYDALNEEQASYNELLRELAESRKKINQLEWKIKHPDGPEYTGAIQIVSM